MSAGKGVGIVGYDYTSGVFRFVSVDASGQLNLEVGPIIVDTSGMQIIASVSGQPVGVSGEAVKISGETVVVAGSGGTMVSVVPTTAATYTPGNTAMEAIAKMVVFDTGAATWRVVRNSLSGLSNIQIATSGSPFVITRNSGETLIARFSGETVLTKATPLTTGRTRGDLGVTAASGGVALASGDVVSVTVKMHLKGSGLVTQSGIIWLGINEAPSSGVGFALYPGDSLTIPIDNMNKVMACALLSGEQITYIGSQY